MSSMQSVKDTFKFDIPVRCVRYINKINKGVVANGFFTSDYELTVLAGSQILDDNNNEIIITKDIKGNPNSIHNMILNNNLRNPYWEKDWVNSLTGVSIGHYIPNGRYGKDKKSIEMQKLFWENKWYNLGKKLDSQLDKIETEFKKYTKEDFEKNVIGHSPDDFIRHIANSNILLLIGAPGTGKNVILNEAIKLYNKEDSNRFIKTVVLTAMSTREDLLGSFRCDESGIIKFEDGSLQEINLKALNDKSKKYVFFLDETQTCRTSDIYKDIINAFAGSREITLPDNNKLILADNLILTMATNPVDVGYEYHHDSTLRRSIVISFYPLWNNEDMIKLIKDKIKLTSKTVEDIIAIMQRASNEISKIYRTPYAGIGTSILTDNKIKDLEDFKYYLDYKIIPYIDNIFKSNINEAKKYRDELYNTYKKATLVNYNE